MNSLVLDKGKAFNNVVHVTVFARLVARFTTAAASLSQMIHRAYIENGVVLNNVANSTTLLLLVAKSK